MTIKAVKQWGSTSTPSKPPEKFSVTLTVPYQVVVEADDPHQAAKKVKNMALDRLSTYIQAKGVVDCPTLGDTTHKITRCILASEKINLEGVDK